MRSAISATIVSVQGSDARRLQEKELARGGFVPSKPPRFVTLRKVKLL